MNTLLPDPDPTPAPVCKGNPDISAHRLIELGRCPHRVGGATYTYVESACPDCGVTARRGPVIFACGTDQKAVTPTPDNCLALAWKTKPTTEVAP